MSQRIRRLRDLAYETALLTAVLIGVWVSTLATVGIAEIVAGSGAALLCALAAVAARQFIGQHWRPRGRWIAWLAPMTLAVPADTARLLVGVLPRLARRSGAGRIRRRRPPAHEEPARAGFRRAWGTFVLSATAGTYVLDWPPDGAEVVYHELGSGPPQLDEMVTR
jgi:hypothetical protein